MRTDHGRAEDGGREEDVSLDVEGLVLEEVLLDDLSADEELERECRKHVQAETEPCNVDQGVVLESKTEISQ